ncbi:MAG: 2-phospho-L-lactate transferase [Chloroflexota bacterium]
MSEVTYDNLKVVVLAGGVGGSKMANGLAQILPAAHLSIIANTADDFEHLGLSISPDLDTIMYNLAGVNNPETGWGRAGETWQVMEALRDLAGPAWFNLGDKDLATNLLRSHWLRQGQPLSWVTAQLCQRFGVAQALLPMTDSPVRTLVQTVEGLLAFQDYFVRRRCEPQVRQLVYDGADTAAPNPTALSALRAADLIVIAPSNPLLSIDPILAVPGLADALRAAIVPRIGISPIIGAAAVKGPAAKIMQELGMEVSPVGVASHLLPVLTGFVFDTVDQSQQVRLEKLGLATLCTNTLMRSTADQARLARAVIEFALR